jgi:ornithine cyclodeaminase/alanine dehydrogenase-like protein (mu-crystallin family)
LQISYKTCVAWVTSALMIKNESKLPAKISLKLNGNVFFNTMPCFIPSLQRIGVKLVSRYPNRIPSLKSEILLYNSETGKFLALIDGDWITTMRTGAVAALSIKILQPRKGGIYSFVGLGNTARSTLLCLLSIQPEIHHHVRLLEYKDQAKSFIERFNRFSNVSFEVVTNNEELLADADVLVSCVTAYDGIFAANELYKEGILLLPVHTKGFQNCDLIFDKIYGDDYEHIRDFKFFDQFKTFVEFSDILNGRDKGRSNSKERIIAYNIGIALHDVYFASMIYSLIDELKIPQISFETKKEKFWI